MSSPNTIVAANRVGNKNNNKNNKNNTPAINFSKNGATVTMNGNRLNNKNKNNNTPAINFSKNGATVTMNGNRLNNKNNAAATANKTNNNKNNNNTPAINFSKNGATVTMNGNRLNNKNNNKNNSKNVAGPSGKNYNKNESLLNNKGKKLGSFGPAVNAKTNNKNKNAAVPSANAKPNNNMNPFGLVFSSNGAPKMINNPLFQANVKKYRPIKNMFTAAGRNTSGIVLNRNNNRPFGYVIPMSVVKNNPNMQVLLKNAGYKEKNNHFVHPLVGASPNGLFVNNAPAPAPAPTVTNTNKNNKNNKNNAECLKLMGEYKSLLQRMKDSKCNMNGIAK